MRKRIKPKLMLDVINQTPERLNLSQEDDFLSLPFRLPLKIIIALGSLLIIVGSAEAPQGVLKNRASAQEATSTQEISGPTDQEKRAALEAQLAELERQIEEDQKTIETYQKQGKTLNNEISTLNVKISKLNLQIKAVNLNLTELNQSINNTQAQINKTENNIDNHKDALSKILRTLYEADKRSLVEVLLANNRLSDFFGNLNDMALIQTNLRSALEEIVKLRQDLLEQKQELSQEKDDAENLKAIQQAQQKSIKTTQTQKATLLKETKGKESEYQKILAKNKATAAEIRSRIFELIGGGELTFAKAYDYAKLAEGATGVRAALILAILDRESLMGKNVGRCSYKTAMHPTRDKPIFLALLSSLNIDPDSQFAYVSCANQHGSYGGAMGPAQFIPSTWKLYADEIAKVTGNSPANPWNNADAFVATGLYIEDLLASKSCKDYADANKHLVSYQTLLEKCAAAKYYSGSSWYTYRNWYGQPVVDKANKFQQDISVLTG